MIARLARSAVSGVLGAITAVVIWNIAVRHTEGRWDAPAGHGRGWRADGRNGWAVL